MCHVRSDGYKSHYDVLLTAGRHGGQRVQLLGAGQLHIVPRAAPRRRALRRAAAHLEHETWKPGEQFGPETKDQAPEQSGSENSVKMQSSENIPERKIPNFSLPCIRFSQYQFLSVQMSL